MISLLPEELWMVGVFAVQAARGRSTRWCFYGMVRQELQEFQDLRGLHRRGIQGMAEVREEEGTSVV